MNAPRNAPAAAQTTTTAAPVFDLDAALEEATLAMHRAGAANKDTKSLSQGEREAALAGLSRALGLNPLTNAVRFIALQGGEALYVTRQGTDQIAARLRINRETIVGPEIRDIAGVKMVFCQVRASSPDGRSDVATATIPLKDPANDLMKVETKAKRRAVLSLVGLGLLTEEDAEAAQASDATRQNDDPTAPWLAALATVATVRDLRGAYNAHTNALRVRGLDGRADVRAWLRARGLLAIEAEVTAVLSTMPVALCDALDLAALEPTDNPEPTPTELDLVTAARRVRATTADQHSTLTAWTILARSYGVATKASLRDAAAALKEACERPEEPPPTGTDGPAREPGSDDGDDGSAAAYEAHRAAQGERAQVTELRVVRDESADPCVTSAAAWREHLATLHSKWHVRGAFHKRASAFAAEGVHTARETATLERLTALGETAPRTLLYSTPAPPRKRAA
jgi:hypothetical protein